MLTDLCVYTIKHSDDLRASCAKGGADTYVERKKWSKAKDLLRKAQEEGKCLPIVFAPAEATRNLLAWATLEKIEIVDDTTRFSFTGLKLFARRPLKTTLRKADDGSPIAEWYVRPYAICRTPANLLRMTRGHVHNEGAPIPEDAYRVDMEDRVVQSLRSSEGERRRRLADASPVPRAVSILRTEYRRNSDVIALVLLSANGRCDLCQLPAPFLRLDGTPYLEVHHITTLAEGGEDSIRNTVALCPNCHRKVHHGGDKERHNQQMQAIAAKRGSA